MSVKTIDELISRCSGRKHVSKESKEEFIDYLKSRIDSIENDIDTKSDALSDDQLFTLAGDLILLSDILAALQKT